MMMKTAPTNPCGEESPPAEKKVNERRSTKPQPHGECNKDPIKNPEVASVQSNRTDMKDDFIVDDDDECGWGND